jgi:hypothetical protein
MYLTLKMKEQFCYQSLQAPHFLLVIPPGRCCSKMDLNTIANAALH